MEEGEERVRERTTQNSIIEDDHFVCSSDMKAIYVES